MVLDELRAQAPSADRDGSASAGVDEDLLRERLAVCFSDWVRVYSSSYAVEEPFIAFIMTLQKQGVLKGEEISSLFFRVCIEVSVDAYIKSKSEGRSLVDGVYLPVDAFAKLISLMIKYHADPAGTENNKAKVHYLNKILGIVALVMAQFHEELGLHFQQKPFFRFYSSLLSNLTAMESHLGSSFSPIMVAVRCVPSNGVMRAELTNSALASQSVNTVQPSHFPGFATSWMSLISHRLLMPKLLAMKDREVSPLFAMLPWSNADARVSRAGRPSTGSS